jgi:rare lipoprotein A
MRTGLGRLVKIPGNEEGVSGKDGLAGRLRLFPHFPVWALLLVWFIGCATAPPPPPRVPGAQKPYQIDNQWYQPIADANGFRQKGLASWYGPDFHGRKTANGEIYNMHDMTAAHTILPLNTWVRVQNMNNNNKIDVRINDRGPFVRGRIIDLSYKAASVLGVVGPGTAPVEIVALGKSAGEPADPSMERQYIPVPYDQGPFAIQVGAFKNIGNAERLKQRLVLSYSSARIVPFDNGRDTLYRVRVGRVTSLTEAGSLEQQLIKNGFPEAMVVAE